MMQVVLSMDEGLKYLDPGFRPDGWEIMGSVINGTDTGALVQSPSGRYMIANASVIKSLDQSEVNLAISEAMNLDRYLV